MKDNRKLWMLAAILFLCGMSVVGCKESASEEQPVDDGLVVEEETCLMAIDRYLASEIGSKYAPGELCIPCVTVVEMDESQPDDIKVWGDFWVYNYNISGDTLKMVSGGDHPGLMQLQKTDKGYEVKSFKQVADGSDNLKSAKEIFGDKFDAFQVVSNDRKARENTRLRITADYVRAHNLPVTMYQDYGWPVVKFSQK